MGWPWQLSIRHTGWPGPTWRRRLGSGSGVWEEQKEEEEKDVGCGSAVPGESMALIGLRMIWVLQWLKRVQQSGCPKQQQQPPLLTSMMREAIFSSPAMSNCWMPMPCHRTTLPAENPNFGSTHLSTLNFTRNSLAIDQLDYYDPHSPYEAFDFQHFLSLYWCVCRQYYNNIIKMISERLVIMYVADFLKKHFKSPSIHLLAKIKIF